MKNFLFNMEKKYGKYAISNLPMILIGCYVVGYVLEMLNPAFVQYLVLNPYLVLHGQVWRLVTWILIPPDSLSLFTIIMLMCYYSIGNSLEHTWGTFRFNLYIFSGMLFTVIGSFVLYGIARVQFADMIDLLGAEQVFDNALRGYGYTVNGETVLLPANWFYQISTYYINMALLLAFIVMYPNQRFYMWMVFPISAKFIGIMDMLIIGYEFLLGDIGTKVVIVASLLNFFIFFFTTRTAIPPSELKRKAEYRKKMHEAKYTGNEAVYQGRNVITRHKCAICGRTELDDENLEFRFCSKCDGNYEYCMDHLYTHEHVKRIVPRQEQ